MATVQARVLKGFRDYLPAAEIPRQRVLRTIAEVFESFGFAPLTTPALEYTEVLLGKYGEEGDKLLYRFDDNGGRDVALRYDLTVPLARVVAQHRDLEVPFRRYQIAPVWRAEKPGKGRFREFLQCDVDIVGEPSIRADAECLTVGLRVMQALGVPGVVARVNNRKILDGLLDGLGVEGTERRHDVLRIVDKLPKIGRDGVSKQLSEAIGLSSEAQERLFAFMALDVSVGLEGVMDAVGGTEQGRLGVEELDQLLSLLKGAGLSEHVEVDLSIARGLDYYTGTIYETFVLDHESYGSVMSGGRYDTLLGMFLKQSSPAVGISVGIERLLTLLTEIGAIEGRAGAADVFAVLFDDESYGPLQRAAQWLREQGVKIEVSLKPAKLGKQFRYAERKGYRWVVIAGAGDLERGEIGLKDLISGTQSTVSLEEIPDLIR
jgi:histidyl-tRNA synthetase